MPSGGVVAGPHRRAHRRAQTSGVLTPAALIGLAIGVGVHMLASGAPAAPRTGSMGSHARPAPNDRTYGIFVRPTRGDIIHTEALYLLDGRGDERSGYLYPYLPGSVARDMRTLAGRDPHV